MSVIPGIFSSSIKGNIIFDRWYHHKLFQRVINATALDTVGEIKHLEGDYISTLSYVGFSSANIWC